jgi:hypothetical protein
MDEDAGVSVPLVTMLILAFFLCGYVLGKCDAREDAQRAAAAQEP